MGQIRSARRDSSRPDTGRQQGGAPTPSLAGGPHELQHTLAAVQLICPYIVQVKQDTAVSPLAHLPDELPVAKIARRTLQIARRRLHEEGQAELVLIKADIGDGRVYGRLVGTGGSKKPALNTSPDSA